MPRECILLDWFSGCQMLQDLTSPWYKLQLATQKGTPVIWWTLRNQILRWWTDTMRRGSSRYIKSSKLKVSVALNGFHLHDTNSEWHCCLLVEPRVSSSELESLCKLGGDHLQHQRAKSVPWNTRVMFFCIRVKFMAIFGACTGYAIDLIC
jgi:hypothetical protein